MYLCLFNKTQLCPLTQEYPGLAGYLAGPFNLCIPPQIAIQVSKIVNNYVSSSYFRKLLEKDKTIKEKQNKLDTLLEQHSIMIQELK